VQQATLPAFLWLIFRTSGPARPIVEGGALTSG
jgi:hypothetical protein